MSDDLIDASDLDGWTGGVICRECGNKYFHASDCEAHK